MRGADVGEGDIADMSGIARSISDVETVPTGVANKRVGCSALLRECDKSLILITRDGNDISALLFAEEDARQGTVGGVVHHFEIYAFRLRGRLSVRVRC